MQKLLGLYKKYRSVISYVFFGVLTTAVNFLLYTLLFNLLGLNNFLSNVISVSASILFAFVTNKLFVFQSHTKTLGALISELAKFLSGRLITAVFEVGFMVLTVDLLHLNGTVMKAVCTVVVLILNYIFSKLWAFKKPK